MESLNPALEQTLRALLKQQGPSAPPPEVKARFRALLGEPADEKPRKIVGKWLVLQGDWGGETFLTVPVSLLGPKAQPKRLLDLMNRAIWSCNVYVAENGADDYGASCFEHEADEDDLKHGVVSGCGGGGLLEGAVWTRYTNMTKEIRECLDLPPGTDIRAE